MPTNWKTFVLILAAAATSPALAKMPPTIPLECGKVSGFKSEAERQYLDKASGGGDVYMVNVTYIGRKPSSKQLDVALRNCLAEAVKKDGSKDIGANAWYRRKEGGNANDDDMLNPYGFLKFIGYVAAKKAVEVRSISLTKK